MGEGGGEHKGERGVDDAGGGIGKDEGGGAAAVEVDGVGSAVFQKDLAHFVVGHTDAVFGLASIDDKEEQVVAFGEAEGGTGVTFAAGFGEVPAVADETFIAADSIV